MLELSINTQSITIQKISGSRSREKSKAMLQRFYQSPKKSERQASHEATTRKVIIITCYECRIGNLHSKINKHSLIYKLVKLRK